MSTSARITKLEKTIRAQARAKYVESIVADFDPAVSRAANDETVAKLLNDARNALIKSGARRAEDEALERFLVEKTPAPACYSQPTLIRLDASGKRLSDTDSAEHIAVLVPNFAPGQDLLIDARMPEKVDQIKHAAEKASTIKLFGEPIGLLNDVQWQPIIDRRHRDPAVHPFFKKTSPTNRWYPTSTPLIEKDGKPNSSGGVWAVGLYYGYVFCFNPSDCGFVRGGRLVPASQF